MLARPWQGGERGMDVGTGRARRGHQRWRAGERTAHQHQALEEVRPQQSAVGRRRDAEIVANHGLDGAMAKGSRDAHDIAQQVQNTERGEIAVEARIPAGSAAVAALVGSKGVVARRGQCREHLAPAVSNLGKAMQQQDRRTARRLVACLEDMHVETVDPGKNASTDAAGKHR
jgi:hypothetical protein